MHSRILAVVAGTALTFSSFAAEALPASPVAAAAAPQIIRVAEGCGPGFVRGPAGGCRRGAVIVRPARPVVVVRPARPAVVVAPRRGGCGVRVPGVAIVTPC